MQKIFIRYMSAVVIVALLAILAMNWGLQEFNARNRMMENSEMKLDQIVQTLENNEVELQNLKDSLSEDYLTRAYAFAYIIEQNPEVLGSQSELERIARLLNVDELHVIDENGILFAGSVPLYFGMDFHDTDQTREFLSRISVPTAMSRRSFSISAWLERIRRGLCRWGWLLPECWRLKRETSWSIYCRVCPWIQGLCFLRWIRIRRRF